MEKILFVALLLASLSKCVNRFFVLPEVAYYGIYWGSFIWLLFREGMKTNKKYLFFISAAFFSIWLNDIPALFKAPFRMFAFFSLAFMVGPFFVNDRLNRMRRLLFIWTLKALRWVMLFSFILKLIAPDSVTNLSGFCGLTSHSMVISPLAGICVLYSFYRFYLAETRLEHYKEAAHLCISFLILLLSGSRGALVATVAGGIIFYFRLYRHQMGKLLQIGLFSLLLAISTSTLWWPYTERLRQKVESSSTNGGQVATRERIWQDRLDEFTAYPIFGVGFASYNLDYIRSEHTINRQTGVIEPGTSWLFLLSSLGLYGFLSFLIPFAYIVYKLFTDLDTGLNGGLFCSIMILFSVHMLTEGYVISSGAYLCFLLWLCLSQCEQIVWQTNNKKLLSV
ncbi:O-antigen ligase family protein [Parabacteroides sp.]